jgi:hypothetical protein
VRTVGAYEIVGELGRGGMAVVHLARGPDGQFVALKELAGFHSGEATAAQRFLREALVGSRLSHPHIVAVYERLEDKGTPFIVMEWVDGGTLRPLVGELSPAQLGGVLEGVLGALAHAGREGIVHRDLKPENIMLTTDGAAKIADFGIAKAKTVVEGLEGRLTRTGTAVGTPGYMAPEQAMGQEVSPATDLYAAGCIAFEALTGRVPFAGEAPMVMLMSHASKDVPDLRTIDPLISPGIADWVAKITSRNPDDRFADGDAAWESLEAALVAAIGSEWREQAKVEPAPPDVALPANGPADLASEAPGAATGAFRTFSAPIGLYEQLAAERGEQQPVAAASTAAADTSSSYTRVSPDEMRAAVRQATPPPRPAAPVAGPSAAAVTAPEMPARSHRGLVIGGAVVAVAAIAGVAIAVAGGGGGSRDGGPALAVDGVTVRAPSGWTAGRTSAVAGIPVAAFAAPAGAAAGDGVGLLTPQAGAQGLLPAALASALTTHAHGITLGGGTRGLRFPGVRMAGGADLVVMPLSRGGALTLVCRGSAAVSACGSVAQSATGALASPPGSSDSGALKGALAHQAKKISAAGRAVASARSAGAQATAADSLSRAFAAQRQAVAAASVGPGARAAVTTLAAALGHLASAWTGYGHAATGSGGNRTAPPGAVAGARSELAAAGAALAAIGLPLGGAFTTGPAPPKLAAPTHRSSSHSTGGSTTSSSTATTTSTTATTTSSVPPATTTTSSSAPSSPTTTTTTFSAPAPPPPPP